MKKIILSETQLRKLVSERHQYQSNEQEENPFNIDDTESNDSEGGEPSPEGDESGFGQQEITPEEQLEMLLQDLKGHFNDDADELLNASRDKFLEMGESETNDESVKNFANGLVRVIDEILKERQDGEEAPSNGVNPDEIEPPVEENPGLNVQNESIEKIKLNFQRFL